MNTEVKKLEKSMVEIKAVFDTEEWAAAQEKALNKLAGSAKLDGFRKGHAPKSLIKAKIGAKINIFFNFLRLYSHLSDHSNFTLF